ncbi:TATA element modulatory factor 1 TATA binding-domain-containing protein [Dipodascopsis uninucleata]
MKIEREKFDQEKFSLQSKIDREIDRSRTREHELKDEITSLEHRLEVLRIQTEELSTGATSDSHAKMLRQIELLQSQYAIATENWQGIEASMQTRVTNLERERDEALKREATSRKRLQDELHRIQELEQESEITSSRKEDLEAELALKEELVSSLRTRLAEENTRLSAIISELEKDKLDLEQRLIEEEKARREEATLQLKSATPELLMINGRQTGSMSPRNGFSRESSSGELQSMGGYSNSSVPTSIQYRRSMRASSYVGRVNSLHSSSSVLSMSALGNQIGSPLSPVASFAPFSESADPERSQISLQNSLVMGHARRSSSSSSIAATDMEDLGSETSTAIGGASSSERMSLVIRRLSSELASAKEELAVLARDRDQARQEIVELMRELKNKKDTESEVAELKKSIEDYRTREQTTLEMLGEKTERVNELQDDVEDLKTMYRQQIQELITKINEYERR